MNKLSKLTDKIKNIKGVEYIIIAVIGLLIVLFVFSDNSFTTSKNSQQGTDVSEYVSSLEKRLENTLSNVYGAGKVKVAITVDGSNKTVIATNQTTIKDGNQLQITETPVMVGGKVVVLTEKYPEITGVIIVASGADDISVRLDLLLATTTLLSVEESKVQILKGK